MTINEIEKRLEDLKIKEREIWDERSKLSEEKGKIRKREAYSGLVKNIFAIGAANLIKNYAVMKCEKLAEEHKRQRMALEMVSDYIDE